MKLLSTRRLTGPNRWTLTPAAIGEVRLSRELDASDLAAWCSRYKACVKQAAEAIGWPDCEAFAVRDGDYLMVGLLPPLDGLYVACDLVEWAVEALLQADEVALAPASASPQASPSQRAGEQESAAPTGDSATDGSEENSPPLPSLAGKALDSFLRMVSREHNPHLLAMDAAARAHGVPFLHDDDDVSLGLGAHCQRWMTNALPSPEALEALEWERYQPIPVAMITGTNGKTTTARMLARIGRCAGYHVGNTSTDGLAIDGKLVEAGDWTGPGGARHILRHNDIDMAVLETARGGMLRRGLVCQWADAAVVTNVADDHLGEWGIDDVTQMAQVKLLIRHGLKSGQPLVLNADCQILVDAVAAIAATGPLPRLSWLTLAADPEATQARLPGGTVDAWCDGENLCLRRATDATATTATEPETIVRLPLAAIPATMGGAASHNVQNAMAAALAAQTLGIPEASLREGLGAFRPSVADSPGRANLFALNGARIMVDFGHNPAGVAAIVGLVNQLDATGRKLVLVGQAGDRSDDEIAGLAREAMKLAPDQVVVKEMLPYLRGRRSWEVPSLLQDTFQEAGLPRHRLTIARSEQDAVRWALSWMQPDDFLVLFIQADITGTLEYLMDLGAEEIG